MANAGLNLISCHNNNGNNYDDTRFNVIITMDKWILDNNTHHQQKYQ